MSRRNCCTIPLTELIVQHKSLAQPLPTSPAFCYYSGFLFGSNNEVTFFQSIINIKRQVYHHIISTKKWLSIVSILRFYCFWNVGERFVRCPRLLSSWNGERKIRSVAANSFFCCKADFRPVSEVWKPRVQILAKESFSHWYWATTIKSCRCNIWMCFFQRASKDIISNILNVEYIE